MELVTGFAGKAHITSAQTGTFNAGVVGGGSYVMPTGEKLTATVITNNLIRVLDGDIVMNGRHITIPKGTYEELEIANGLQGMKRNDLIVARYEKDANTGIETASLVVIQGTSTDETASDPEYNDNDIAEGTLISDMPLYRITLDGLTVGEPEPLFTVAKSMEELKNCISVLENTTDELNNKLVREILIDEVYYRLFKQGNVYSLKLYDAKISRVTNILSQYIDSKTNFLCLVMTSDGVYHNGYCGKAGGYWFDNTTNYHAITDDDYIYAMLTWIS